MSARVTRAVQLAAGLDSAGIPATADVNKLLGRLPAVLVMPPRLQFDVAAGATATWRLMVVSDQADEWAAWQQLDGLIAAVDAELPLDSADPALFAPNPGADTRPAYALTYTETVES